MRSSTDKRAASTDMTQSADTRTPEDKDIRAHSEALMKQFLADYQTLSPTLQSVVRDEIDNLIRLHPRGTH